ncbi:MAG TPA: type II CAAX endopeptidase family protein [Candidatus Aquilonibacter sp.]|nr:type II CAAX endopeptidase family protein [Candidatus Aquilonibacter sp.]
MTIDDDRSRTDPSGPSDGADPQPAADFSPYNDSTRSGFEPALPEGFPAPSRRALPDDLRVPWDWIDILLLVIVAFCGIFLIGLLLFSGLRFAGISAFHSRRSPDFTDALALVAQVVLDLGLLVYLAAQIHLRFRAPFWRTIGWRPLGLHSRSRGFAYPALVLSGFSLAVIVAFAEGLFPPKHPLPIQTMTANPRVALIFLLTAVLVAPVVEETIFRGYLYPVAARSFGIGPGILLTGTLFGLLHASQLWGGWWQIALLVVVGIIFTAVRAATRTVVASYILHASYNALPVLATLLSALRFRHMPLN